MGVLFIGAGAKDYRDHILEEAHKVTSEVFLVTDRPVTWEASFVVCSLCAGG